MILKPCLHDNVWCRRCGFGGVAKTLAPGVWTAMLNIEHFDNKRVVLNIWRQLIF